MNDFTKEELKELHDCIHWKINEGQEEKLTTLVDKKIQSMIDNYCEHKFILHTNAPYVFIMCVNCNKTYVDDSFPG